jgi:hypothetical protein
MAQPTPAEAQYSSPYIRIQSNLKAGLRRGDQKSGESKLHRHQYPPRHLDNNLLDAHEKRELKNEASKINPNLQVIVDMGE